MTKEFKRVKEPSNLGLCLRALAVAGSMTGIFIGGMNYLDYSVKKEILNRIEPNIATRVTEDFVNNYPTESALNKAFGVGGYIVSSDYLKNTRRKE